MNTDAWNQRYSNEEYAYGEGPNEFFKEHLNKLEEGSILLPADGEGRNGVYAASKGWQVTSFDLSIEGKMKAQILAEKYNTSLSYKVGDFHDMDFQPESFDAMALIYAHFPAEAKSEYHKELSEYVKPGGYVILEAFSKSNLERSKANPSIGGPKNIDMLFSIKEIKEDFVGFDFLILEERLVDLHEGKYHQGTASVVRFLGRKR